MASRGKEVQQLIRPLSTGLFIFACFLLLATSHLFADDPTPALETQHDKESYSIGYQVGISMKNDGVEVNFEKLTQGLRDAIDGNAPLLSEEEMKKLIVDRKKVVREAEMRKVQELRVRNAEEAEKFLEENSKKEGVKTTESGLQYKVLVGGDGTTPHPEDFVTVNYRGMFIDGTEFDSSYTKGEPMTTQVDSVIKGWTEALQMMKEGSKWKIFLPPHLAYGRGGMGTRIPPNKLLVFEIELLSIKKGDDAVSQ
jgi:FKBP-type peptidyl-prolyl cis-trans isomerase FklB